MLTVLSVVFAGIVVLRALPDVVSTAGASGSSAVVADGSSDGSPLSGNTLHPVSPESASAQLRSSVSEETRKAHPGCDTSFALVRGATDRYLSCTEQELADVFMNPGLPVAERVAALHYAGQRQALSLLDYLIAALQDPIPEIAAAAADSLGVLGDPRAIAPLLARAEQSDVELRQKMAHYLSAPAGTGNPPAQVLPVVAGDRPNPFLCRTSILFRLDLLSAPYFEDDGSLITPREFVARGLQDPELQVRLMAAKLAAAMDHPGPAAALMAALQNQDESGAVRALAAEALGKLGAEQALPALLESMDDPQPAVRLATAVALGNFPQPMVVSVLLSAMNDTESFVRCAVIASLGIIGDPQALESLFEALGDTQESVRVTAEQALSKFGEPQKITGIQKRFEHAGHREKIAILGLLARFEDAAALTLLQQAKLDDNQEIRYHAAMALLTQGQLDALDGLIAASQSLDEELLALLPESFKLSQPGELSQQCPKFTETVGLVAITECAETDDVPGIAETTGTTGTTTEPGDAGEPGDATETAEPVVTVVIAETAETAETVETGGAVETPNADNVVSAIAAAYAGAATAATEKEACEQDDRQEDESTRFSEFFASFTAEFDTGTEHTTAADLLQKIVQRGLHVEKTEALGNTTNALAHANHHVRRCAAANLGFSPFDRAFNVLLEALDDPHEIVRVAAIKSLANFGRDETIGYYEDLIDDPAESVRLAVARNVVRLHDQQRAKSLLRYLQEEDQSAHVRRVARRMLEVGNRTG